MNHGCADPATFKRERAVCLRHLPAAPPSSVTSQRNSQRKRDAPKVSLLSNYGVISFEIDIAGVSGPTKRFRSFSPTSQQSTHRMPLSRFWKRCRGVRAFTWRYTGDHWDIDIKPRSGCVAGAYPTPRPEHRGNRLWAWL